MRAEVFVKRLFTVNGQEAACSFFQPEADRENFRCRYEIEWPQGALSKHAYGIDEVQALLLAMQRAHIDLLAARENQGQHVSWLDEKSLGLPIPETIRDWDPENRF
jgi:hypothetical protein